MGSFRKSLFLRPPCLPLLVGLVVHILTACLHPGQAASVSSVYSHSSFSHRRYDQTSLPILREQFANAFKEAVGDVRTSLKMHADNFDVFFRDLLKVSHHNFDKMFSDTYGLLYDKHSTIFNDMFRDLEKYYSTGSVDLTASLKQFFSLLYKKMFQELNSQYDFDAAYLECTVENMEEMMPFGEMPQKLILQIKRSFIAIRTFVQALNYGSQVLKTIMDVPVTSSCENRLRTMSYCRNCANSATSQLEWPCQDTCTSQIERACIPYGVNLNREWNLYVSDIAKLVNRLKTSFNIELAVKPINIQISEAIMTFQENAETISKRLFSKCGKPGLKRSRRNTYTYNQRISAHATFPTSAPRHLPTMDTLIGDILKTLKNYKHFWSHLPRYLCSQYSNSQNNCNNQTQRSAEPLNYRDKNNVEIVSQQIGTLKLISANVNNAYNGLDVDLENNLKHSNEGLNGNVPIDDEISGSGDELSGSGEEPSGAESEAPPEVTSTATTNDFLFTSTNAPTTMTKSPSRDHLGPDGISQRQPSSAPALPSFLWPLVCSLFLCLFLRP